MKFLHFELLEPVSVFTVAGHENSIAGSPPSLAAVAHQKWDGLALQHTLRDEPLLAVPSAGCRLANVEAAEVDLNNGAEVARYCCASLGAKLDLLAIVGEVPT